MLLFQRRGLARRFGYERGDQPVAVGALLFHCLDVEAQPRQRFREKLQVLVAHRSFRIGIGLDLLLAQLEQPVGVLEPQDAQCAANLLAVLA